MGAAAEKSPAGETLVSPARVNVLPVRARRKFFA
jgi:hypothetical protein